MTHAERVALAKALFGTAEKPGPIDVGWAKQHLGVGSGTTMARWRADGIPSDKVRGVLEKISAALPTQKTTPLPDWAEGLAHRAADDAITRLVPEHLVRRLPAFLDQLEVFLRQADEDAHEESGSQDPDGSAQQGRTAV